MTSLGLHGVCGVNTRSALQIKAKKKHLMRYCVTDKHLERLKVRVTNYQIGIVGPLNHHQEADISWEAADNLTEHNCISGDKVSGNVN